MSVQSMGLFWAAIKALWFGLFGWPGSISIRGISFSPPEGEPSALQKAKQCAHKPELFQPPSLPRISRNGQAEVMSWNCFEWSCNNIQNYYQLLQIEL